MAAKGYCRRATDKSGGFKAMETKIYARKPSFNLKVNKMSVLLATSGKEVI